MKKTSLAAVILVGLAAVIWTIRAVLEIVLKTYKMCIRDRVYGLKRPYRKNASFIMNDATLP